jgi:hypothetical protein
VLAKADHLQENKKVLFSFVLFWWDSSKAGALLLEPHL